MSADVRLLGSVGGGCKEFTEAGVEPGRGAFAGWADGEPGLARAAWCVVRHLRPSTVVETGVARGVTSRVVLEALEANGDRQLWSVDLPPASAPRLHTQIGMVVSESVRHRWTYVRGSSRHRLPGLLADRGQIDLFFMTASTPSETCCSSWIWPGASSCQVASCWRTTSTSTAAFTSFRPLSAPPPRCWSLTPNRSSLISVARTMWASSASAEKHHPPATPAIERPDSGIRVERVEWRERVPWV